MIAGSVRLGWALGLLGLVVATSPGLAETVTRRAVRAEDTVLVRVAGEPELSKTYTVNPDGEIVLAFVGPVKVAGLTPEVARDRLTQQLRRYIRICDVQFDVVSSVASPILVLGEVARPGALQMREGLTLLGALAAVGNPTGQADRSRIRLGRGGETAQYYDLDTLLRSPSLDPRLISGDMLTVPSRIERRARVEGQVRKPAEFKLDDAPTAYAAVHAAEPNERADLERVLVRRATGETLALNLSGVERGDLSGDRPLAPGDRVLVGTRSRGLVLLRGELKTPGSRELLGKRRLIDFLLDAGGGWTEQSDRSAVEVERGGQVRVFDLSPDRQSDLAAEFDLEPGDVIRVRSDAARRLTIVGAVRKPGAYPARAAMTVLDALASAEGPTDKAALKNVVIVPANPADSRLRARTAGKRVRPEEERAGLLVVDLARLQKGDPSQNVEVRAGDRILVPDQLPAGGKTSILDTVARAFPIVALLRGFGGGAR